MADHGIKRLSASYTIEAAYVMAVVFMALATMILGAYRIHDETAGKMAVLESVEKQVYQEEAWTGKEEDKLRIVYLKDSCEVKVKRQGNKITGTGKGERWSLEIQRKKYEPERFLRMMSMAQDGFADIRKQEE